MSLIDGIVAEEKRYAAMPYTETGNNHQIFSDIVNSYGLKGYQDDKWCATYQFAMELQACGKDKALENWCMTDGYCGYSCKDTERKFAAKGKTGSTPKVGALVIFKRSHMGRVLSVNGSTFTCGEGNTSNKEFNRDGDSCAVKTYSCTDPGISSFCYINYEDMNAKTLINACKAVYEMAHYGHYTYGDSKSRVPCADHVISCDRLIARALWNLGYQDQPSGGITVVNMETYLLKHGFYKVTNEADVKAGDIVLFRNANLVPNAGWHTFIVTAVTKSGSVMTVNKYDMGSQQRIDSPQPFINVPLNQWRGTRWFYCAFRIGKPTPAPDDQYAYNEDYYKMAWPDVVKAYGKASLKKHYDLFGKKEGRAANCILTPSYYKEHYKDLRAAFGENWVKYIDHFTAYGVKEGRRGSIVFDYNFYRNKYGDLVKAFGTDKKKYFKHFIDYGMKEGRQGSADFDPRSYRKRYKDLDKAYGDKWPFYYRHYLIYGLKEKRKGV